MTRTKQAIEKAKEWMIDQDPRWSDPHFRKQVWEMMHPIQKQMWLREMEFIAQSDLDYPYPLESTQ